MYLKIKTFNKKFILALGVIVTLVGIAAVKELVKNNFAAAENSFNLTLKPVALNIQVDLEKEDDRDTIYNLLNEIEKHNGRATVFVTGEFASKYPEVVRDIENRGHQIAVHGWQREEDLTHLNFNEQLALIKKAFSTVRMATTKQEAVVDFKPQGYKFNVDTIRALQEFGARSISGIFESNDHESFSKCWYVQSLGKVTFPYPITNEFWAIPISQVNKIPLDDEYFANSQDFLNFLIEGYNQKFQTKEPLIIVIHPSITGGDNAKLNVLSQFLDYVKQNDGKIKPLSAFTHHTQYITNLKVIPSTTTVSVGEEITITVNYTSNIWCPYYRFLMYGRYPGQKWQLLENVDPYCEFVYLGDHSFSRKVRIPRPPGKENTFTIRVVGRATYGGCPPIDNLEYWPNYENFDVAKDIEIKITKPSLCIPYIINDPTHQRVKDVIFVPDEDYWEVYGENALNKFKEDMEHKINERLGGVSPIKENMDKFNFYYTEKPGKTGSAPPHKLPRVSFWRSFWKDESCKFADMVMILHAKTIDDWCEDNKAKVCSAEGPTRDLPSNSKEICWTEECKAKFDRSFIHESGHGIFDLRDEYNAAPNCKTMYADKDHPLPPKPNIWNSEESCRNDAISQGWNPDECYQFTTCQGGFWKLGDPKIKDLNERYFDPNHRYIMFDGEYFYNGFGKASERRINYVFNEELPKAIDILYPCPWCPKYAEKLAEKSISLYLNINNNQLTLLESEISESAPPNYSLGNYPFRAEIVSLTGEVLGEYGFSDPRVILGEIGYQGPTWIDNVDFPLILPYFHNAKTINIYNSADELLLSVDVSQYASGIIDGKVVDTKGNPVSNAFVQVIGVDKKSTYTDENGYYQLVGLMSGNYTINVTPDPYANLMSAHVSVSVQAGEIITQDFTLNLGGSIGGKVTDVNGNPVPNAHLYLSGYEMPRYATNEEGKYIIPGLEAGTYTINIDAPGYESWYIFVNNKFVKKGNSINVEVKLGETTWVDFTQKPPPMPDIWVEPKSFELELPWDAIEKKILTIGNSGEASLEFEIKTQAGTLITDPQEDDLVDVKNVLASVETTTVNFLIETYSPLPDYFWGYLWLDTDQSSSTGATDQWWPGYGLNDIGADYALSISKWGEYSGGYLYRWTGEYFEFVSSLPISLNENSIAISLPLSEISDDGNLDFTLVMGSEGVHHDDVVPDEGYGSTKIGAIDWVSTSLTAGTLNPGEKTEITLTIDTTNLKPGTYKGYIVINSNDLDESIIYLPIDLFVRKKNVVINVTNKEGFAFDDVILEAEAKDENGELLYQERGSGYFVEFRVGTSTIGTTTINATGKAKIDWKVNLIPKEVIENYPIVVIFAGNEYYNPAQGEGTFTLKSAKWLKEDVIKELESAKTGEKRIDKRTDKIVWFINQSLNENLWLDASRLVFFGKGKDSDLEEMLKDENMDLEKIKEKFPKSGILVFENEKTAVELMMEKPNPEALKEMDDFRDLKIPEKLKPVFERVIEKLVKADFLLAKVSLFDAKNAKVQNQKFRKIVASLIEKAEKELQKANQELRKGRPDKAIKSLEKSWLYSQLAIKFAQKEIKKKIKIGN